MQFIDFFVQRVDLARVGLQFHFKIDVSSYKTNYSYNQKSIYDVSKFFNELPEALHDYRLGRIVHFIQQIVWKDDYILILTRFIVFKIKTKLNVIIQVYFYLFLSWMSWFIMRSRIARLCSGALLIKWIPVIL